MVTDTFPKSISLSISETIGFSGFYNLAFDAF